MTRYVALLRGINIGGHQVRMERLRELFEELGFAGVSSYIQTGNVFFDAPAGDRRALEERIEAHLGAALGYAVPTFIRTVDELKSSLDPDPFEGVEPTPETRFPVLFISRPIAEELDLPLEVETPDLEIRIVRVTPGELYLVTRRLRDRPGNPAIYVERRWGVRTTARFYHTAQKILAAAQS